MATSGLGPVDINTTPALSAPPGDVNNFQNPESLQSYTVLTVALSITLSLLVLLLRLFTKAYLLRDVRIDDYLLILSVIGLIAFSAVLVAAGNSGQGTHQWNLTIKQLQRILHLANVLEVLYCPVMLIAKLSVLIQLIRLFVVSRPSLYFWLTHILVVANCCSYIALTVAFALSCIPRRKLWNLELPGHCISSTGVIIASSLMNVISDVAILILPVFAVWRLQLPVKSKLIASAAFGSGIFAFISSVIRLVYGVQLIHTKDFSWGIEPIGLWAVAEIATVILAGSIPVLPKFVRWVRGQEGSSSGSGQSRSTRPVQHSEQGPFSKKDKSWAPNSSFELLAAGNGSFVGCETEETMPDAQEELQQHIVKSI